MKYFWLILFFSTSVPANAGTILTMEKSEVIWKSGAGRTITVHAPEVAGQPGVLRKSDEHESDAVLEYAVANGSVSVKISGEKDVLVARVSTAFDRPVTDDVETVLAFDVDGEPAQQLGLPEQNGVFKVLPVTKMSGAAGKFELGNAANGPGPALGMPVVGLIFGAEEQQLAVAADPYCGSDFQVQGRRIMVRTTYRGALVPVTREERTVALVFHRDGADGTCRAFYRTIPEIEPGAPWTQGIQLVYYDYLSEKGAGWFKDLQTLADKIPHQHRGHVALCLHGWYDYFQQYAYDHKTGKLLDKWTAFPVTCKVPMSLAEMHRRLKFAKNLGFRVLLYFGDGTNSDSGAPNFHPEYVLKDKNGKTSTGWQAPDSLGKALKMDPGVPELRDWQRGYLKALLAEYGRDMDGFVWDETFHIPTNLVSYPDGKPSYANRAMMGLVGELAQMTQAYRQHNPDLVFLASDNGKTNYALVAHGTYQDSAMEERHWGPSMFANYRNCLWSCNWFPLRHAKQNEIAAEEYGLPQGLSNGWDDNCGPNRMPPELLDAVLQRFTKNVESNRQRLRYLSP